MSFQILIREIYGNKKVNVPLPNPVEFNDANSTGSRVTCYKTVTDVNTSNYSVQSKCIINALNDTSPVPLCLPLNSFLQPVSLNQASWM